MKRVQKPKVPLRNWGMPTPIQEPLAKAPSKSVWVCPLRGWTFCKSTLTNWVLWQTFEEEKERIKNYIILSFKSCKSLPYPQICNRFFSKSALGRRTYPYRFRPRFGISLWDAGWHTLLFRVGLSVDWSLAGPGACKPRRGWQDRCAWRECSTPGRDQSS